MNTIALFDCSSQPIVLPGPPVIVLAKIFEIGVTT